MLFDPHKPHGKKFDRWEITIFLNNHVHGFIEGLPSPQYLHRTLLRWYNGASIPEECIKRVEVGGRNEDRWLISMQIDFEGEHYESIYRNFKYWDGMDF